MVASRQIGEIMNKIPSVLSIATISFLCTAIVMPQTIQREVKRTSEKEVHVSINSSFGSVNIAKGEKDKIVKVFYRGKEKENKPELDLEYYLNGNIGDLRMELHPEKSRYSNKNGEITVNINESNFRTDEWYISLSDAVPLSIEAELGAGKSNFDLSGLNISDLSISTGASKSSLAFNEMNKGEVNKLRIETGVSKFSAENLNNANFRSMSFESGVGSYYLDFGGELRRTVDVTINVGLGAVTVVIPKKIGVKVKYEDSWLSNLTIDDEFIRKKKGIYESENYSTADGRMNVYIESGLGSVKVKRSR